MGKLVHAFEILGAIEKAKDQEKINLMKEYGAKVPLSMLLTLNFRSDLKLDLPEGMPPMDTKDMDMTVHPDFQGHLGAGIHRLKNCLTTNPIKKFKKEQVFYEVMVNSPIQDRDILCACKDKQLEELYPSITAEFVKSVFPSYVKEEGLIQ